MRNKRAREILRSHGLEIGERDGGLKVAELLFPLTPPIPET